MEILFVVLASVAIGIALAVAMQQPLMLLVALIAGAIVANRIGYRHQAKAIKSELDKPAGGWPGQTTPSRSVEQRIAELERLKAAGTITEAEYTEKRAAVLADL